MALANLVRGRDNTYLLSSFIPKGVDPTIYTASLSICEIPKTGTNRITGATAANPIVITSVAHGLDTGDQVAIVNVGGLGEAKGAFAVTVLDDDTFSLNGSDGTGHGPFTRGGEWYKALPAACGLSFASTPPRVTIPGLFGLIQSRGYILVVTVLGTYRDQLNALAYVSAVDNKDF